MFIRLFCQERLTKFSHSGITIVITMPSKKEWRRRRAWEWVFRSHIYLVKLFERGTQVLLGGTERTWVLL